MAILRIEQAGYAVYFALDSGIVTCVAFDSSKPRIVVGADKNGDRCAAAFQVAEKIGLTLPAA